MTVESDMEYNWNANIEIFGRRGPAPVDVIPQGSHGLSSSVYRSNLSGVDETRKRSGVYCSAKDI